MPAAPAASPALPATPAISAHPPAAGIAAQHKQDNTVRRYGNAALGPFIKYVIDDPLQVQNGPGRNGGPAEDGYYGCQYS